VPGVKQNLGSIMQKNTFVGEDIRPLEAIDLEGESEDEEEDRADSADGDEAEAEAWKLR
jgi:nuclear GTP-binding protein